MTAKEYEDNVSEDKKEAFIKLKQTIKNNLPDGFEEAFIYNMIGYVVPFDTFPSGYHCDSKIPLPFINIAAQKNFIAIYHMGLYADTDLYNWFVNEYPKYSKSKLDMGKSCLRFKKPNEIPFDLIGELMRKMSVERWIEIYTNNLQKK